MLFIINSLNGMLKTCTLDRFAILGTGNAGSVRLSKDEKVSKK